MPSEGLPKAHSRRLLRRERRGEGEEVLIVLLLLIAVLLLCATAQLLPAARIMVAAMMSCWIFCFILFSFSNDYNWFHPGFLIQSVSRMLLCCSDATAPLDSSIE